MKQKSTQAIPTAYHEAGHAVMYLLTKNRFEYVTIIPSVNASGEKLGGHLHLSEEQGRKTSESWGLPYLFYGGFYAERKYRGRSNLGGAWEDIKTASEMMKPFTTHMSKESEHEFWIGIDKDARKMIKKNWPKVNAIALALLEKKTLTYDKVLEIVGESKL